MGFSVGVKESAEEEIKNLDGDKQTEIFAQLEKLEDFPKKYGKPLRGQLNGLWQLRSGKYRIWYTIEDETVEVRAVKHKEDAKEHY
ncbi:type II toxin-antitoxin system RelE family toxin [Candidatus Nanohalobium constans]|uniref:Addiction module toxin, RelE/StbE family n=1 Tax=Candidatus Nanohalobium constans TaxID=2565781 RepID=A0A5Q0UGX8_9ARCH|nr:type II toxin-antitoxin system RelE/ParE family toxin [Candidatus Nanohalobium constans]QGA80205.1 addiction module toxin, RelE/StbE family [Candidatus Nanohalobium constans]